MLKSTKKEVIERIKKYITDNTEEELVEAIDWDNEHNTGEITQTTKELFASGKVFEACSLYIMEDWKAHKNPHYPANFQENFVDWLYGLPLNIADYILRGPDAKAILKEWLEQTEAEQERFSDTEAEQHLGRLIYREISKSATKNGFVYPW